jgi:hypothetical protein
MEKAGISILKNPAKTPEFEYPINGYSRIGVFAGKGVFNKI